MSMRITGMFNRKMMPGIFDFFVMFKNSQKSQNKIAFKTQKVSKK